LQPPLLLLKKSEGFAAGDGRFDNIPAILFAMVDQ